MTGKRTSDEPARSATTSVAPKTSKPKIGDDAAQALKPDPPAAAKASVHEAIGKLIGDDAERERGTAEKEATAVTPGKPTKSRNSK